MKICHPGPSRWTDHVREFDRFRTCDHQTHKLALYQLSYKLHVVAPEGIEPSLTEQKPVVLPLYHRAIYLRRLKDSNLWDVYRLLVFKTSAIDQLCQTSMVCDSWEIRTRVNRMKICHPGPSRWTDHVWEFDRFRTCDHQTHKLALYQLSYKLHVVAPEGIEPSLTEPKPVVLLLYHRAIYLRRLKDSNFRDQVGLVP